MTNEQRAQIRGLFGQLGVGDAHTQFEVTEELTGTRIRSVAELDSATAHRLIAGLHRRLANLAKVRSGNSWDDREDDTWIDRL
jgi:DNA polymerase-3 subunit epsilon